MIKTTRTSTIAAFMNKHQEFDFNDVCARMFEEGMFKSLGEARDWAKYVIRAGHVSNMIIPTARAKRTTPAPAPAPAPVVETKEEAKKRKDRERAAARRAAAKAAKAS